MSKKLYWHETLSVNTLENSINGKLLYGKSIGKVIYVDNDAELLFNVTFRVECILKGQDIKNRIEITDAGIKSDRIACQYLDPGNAYVVFLEKCGLNMNAYCPIDVQERLADDTTLELLEKTCRLKRNPPLDSLSNNCPSVSMPEFCHYNNISTKRKVVDYINTNDKPLFNNGTQIFHGSNKIIIKEGKLIDLIGDNPRHDKIDRSRLLQFIADSVRSLSNENNSIPISCYENNYISHGSIIPNVIPITKNLNQINRLSSSYPFVNDYSTTTKILYFRDQLSRAAFADHRIMTYNFTSENTWLTMPDGVRLSATLVIPISQRDTNENFPVLLEYKPYRKDDSFFNFNQPKIHYLAQRGFIVALVDIRGTGSSEGVLIEYEYTSQELNDCEHVIELLAGHARSNGRVGMYGLSWSAFNSLMMATLRRPPALHAVFAAHGSEDLYNNDVHYGDGILHQDEYILSVDHENALPASPDYLINEQWTNERFTRRPWIDIYLEHQLNDKFWQNHSIKYSYDNLTVPVYLLAGLYDAYRDFAINIYEHAHQISPKIKVVVGPFVHAMPEFSTRNPGPGYDGTAEMIRWFNHWLKDNDDSDDILNEPDITLFVRTSLTTGTYRYESHWPIPQ
ncbi:unnamed protein product [Rotaria magnacalcarata]